MSSATPPRQVYDVRFVFTSRETNEESFSFMVRGFKTVASIEKFRKNLSESNFGYIVGFQLFVVNI